MSLSEVGHCIITNVDFTIIGWTLHYKCLLISLSQVEHLYNTHVDYTVIGGILHFKCLLMLFHCQVEHCIISNVDFTVTGGTLCYKCWFHCHRWNIVLQMLISLSCGTLHYKCLLISLSQVEHCITSVDFTVTGGALHFKCLFISLSGATLLYKCCWFHCHRWNIALQVFVDFTVTGGIFV